MEIENLILVKTRQELRDWLESHAASEKCCWIIDHCKQK